MCSFHVTGPAHPTEPTPPLDQPKKAPSEDETVAEATAPPAADPGLKEIHQANLALQQAHDKQRIQAQYDTPPEETQDILNTNKDALSMVMRMDQFFGIEFRDVRAVDNKEEALEFLSNPLLYSDNFILFPDPTKPNTVNVAFRGDENIYQLPIDFSLSEGIDALIRQHKRTS